MNHQNKEEMIMSSEDFVNALYSGKNLEAEDAFKVCNARQSWSSVGENKRREVANNFCKNKDRGRWRCRRGLIHSMTPVTEKDEHKKSKLYKKLSPKMRDAVDDIFAKMDSKPQDFLNTFEKTIQQISKKYRVSEKELMGYFEKEMLTI